MIKDILLLTKSKKNNGYCVTGIDLNDGKWIRLLTPGDNNFHIEEFKYEGHSLEPELLDIMRVAVGNQCGTELHPEDYYAGKIFSKINNILGSRNIFNKRLEMDIEHEYVYYNTNYRLDSVIDMNVIKDGNHSLHLLHASDLIISKDKSDKFIASFKYNNQNYNGIRITDTDFLHSITKLQHFKSVNLGEGYYIVVSLGDSFFNQFTNRYENYKLVASIISEEMVEKKLEYSELNFDMVGTLEEIYIKHKYYPGIPLVVNRTTWTNDYYYVVESVVKDVAIGSTYKKGSLYKKDVKYRLTEDRFKLNKSMLHLMVNNPTTSNL